MRTLNQHICMFSSILLLGKIFLLLKGKGGTLVAKLDLTYKFVKMKMKSNSGLLVRTRNLYLLLVLLCSWI